MPGSTCSTTCRRPAAQGLLAIGIVVANYLCALAGLTSISRMIFAFARDGGLPARHCGRRQPDMRTPVAAIWLGAVLSVAATLYSPAFAALAAGCALFLYVSYAMPIAAGLLAEGKSWTEFGPFRLGIWSKPIAVIRILGVLVLMYAGIQPPFDILINYAIGLIVLLAGPLVRHRVPPLQGPADRRRYRSPSRRSQRRKKPLARRPVNSKIRCSGRRKPTGAGPAS